MANDPTQMGFPQLGSPFVFTEGTEAGTLTPAAYRLLLALWNRSGGGGPVISSQDLQVLTSLPQLPPTSGVIQANDTALIALFQIAIAGAHAAKQTPVAAGASFGIVASETLSSPAIVNVWSNAGVANARNANATDLTKPANGFVLGNFASGSTATVYMPGQFINGLASLSAGSTYWLSTTSGQFTTTAPATSGNGDQQIGFAVSATVMFFAPQLMVGV